MDGLRRGWQSLRSDWRGRAALIGWAVVTSAIVFTPRLQAEAFDFVQVARSATPAVVNVGTYADYAIPSHITGARVNDYVNEQRSRGPQGRALSNLGTGFVFDDKGYVMTSSHVVKDFDAVVVQLTDRSEVPAKVVGKDVTTDIAVLKILDASVKLKPLTLKRERSLQVGEWVMAIGSPFGLEFSVSKGIVSAVDRTLSNESYVPYIQTDVPTNMGNSGGPLLNGAGQVVGVNTQIATGGGDFEGVSFAVPADVALMVATRIKEKGYFDRPWLGVVVQEIDESLASSFGLRAVRGALVAHVIDGGPADQAGLEVGDVIMRVNDTDIIQAPSLPQLIGQKPVGESVQLMVVRDGGEQSLTLDLIAMPPEALSIRPGNLVDSLELGELTRTIEISALGISVGDIEADVLKGTSIQSAVRVTGTNNYANGLGLQTGDLITMVNGQPVANAEGLLGSLNGMARDQWEPMLIMRKGHPKFVPIRIEGRQ